MSFFTRSDVSIKSARTHPLKIVRKDIFTNKVEKVMGYAMSAQHAMKMYKQLISMFPFDRYDIVPNKD